VHPRPTLASAVLFEAESMIRKVSILLLAVAMTCRVQAAADPKLERLVRQGSYELGKKQYDLAVSHLTAALLINHDNKTAAVIYQLRANAYRGKEELNKAMNDANEAIRVFPQFPGGYLARGMTYRRQGQLDKAISDYGTVLRLNPYSIDAYNNRGNAYNEKGQHELAIRDYDEAIRRNPKSADAYGNRGTSYDVTGKWDKALADYNQAIRLNPALMGLYYNRGTLYAKKGNYRQAGADLAIALKKTQNDQELINAIAWLRATNPEASLRNGKEAVSEATRVCKLSNWKNVDYIDTLAAAYAEAGDFDQAVKYQRQAIDMKSANAKDREKLEQRLRLYQDHKPFRVQAETPPTGDRRE
jgi:tetratricopeptide (TPR) repeat protein